MINNKLNLSKYKLVTYRFILPLLLGILIGIISAFFKVEFPVRFLNTISENILAIISVLSPFIIFVSVATGISNITNNKVKFLGQFFGLILVSLLLIGFFTLFISLIIDPLLTFGTKDFNIIYIDPYSNFVLHFPEQITLFFNSLPIDFLAVLIGLFFGSLFSPKRLVSLKIVSFEKYLYTFLRVVILPLMPLWIIGSFAATAYSGVASDFFLTDFLLSILILFLQIGTLGLLYLIASKLKHINFRKIKYSGLKVFAYVISLSGVGTSVVIPYIVKEQEYLNVDKNVAQTITATSFNMPGSLIANIVFIVGVLNIFNTDITLSKLLFFTVFLVFLLIIAPAIPGGSISIIAPKLSFLGFTPAMVSLFTTMYYKQGISNSATNNAADLYIGVLLSKNNKNFANDKITESDINDLALRK